MPFHFPSLFLSFSRFKPLNSLSLAPFSYPFVSPKKSERGKKKERQRQRQTGRERERERGGGSDTVESGEWREKEAARRGDGVAVIGG